LKAFTVNVGINTTPEALGRSAPIYPNGTFNYVPIPTDDENTPTYEELGFTSTFERMRIEDRLKVNVHHDPEFVTFTFGDFPTRSRTSHLKDMEYGDLLLFIASLKQTKHKVIGSTFQKWIIPNRGMYLIGMFEVIGILTKDGEQFSKKLGRNAYKKNPHYKRFQENESEESWIFKGSNRSTLFPIAVPLFRTDLRKMFGIRLAKTNQTETAQVNSYTRTAREVADIAYLSKIIRKRCPLVPILGE
jgi:hypothetical protein